MAKQKELKSKLSGMQIKELLVELRKSKEKVAELKTQAATGKLSKNHEIKETKKYIAQISTIISEKQWKEFESQESKEK